MSQADTIAVTAALDEAVATVRAAWGGTPALGIVAGSGLTALGEMVEQAVVLPYGDIPNMPAPAVAGHAGVLVAGEIAGLPVVVLSGRVHRYEGHPMEDIVFGVRMLARLGTPRVLLTNAAGGIDPWLRPGSLVRIADHLNMTGDNPLFGPNIAALGPRFPDMSFAYDPELGQLLDQAAADANVTLARGVYAAVAGPSYETPAEIRMLRTLGANVVGMSTVPECIALRHMGVLVAGVSVVSNAAAGVGSGVLDHAEVKEAAADAGPSLLRLIQHFAAAIARDGGS